MALFAVTEYNHVFQRAACLSPSLWTNPQKLAELIAQSSHVFIMGHSNADLDALGAAAGLQPICRKKGKKAHIVLDMEQNAVQELLKKLKRQKRHENNASPRGFLFILSLILSVFYFRLPFQWAWDSSFQNILKK